MASRSSEVKNQDITGQAATALPFLFPPRRRPAGFGEFDFHSDFILRDAERPQTVLRDLATDAYGQRMHAIVSRRLQHEAIPTLGRLAKRVLDLALSAAALLLLWPLMLVIAIAVKLESRGPAIYASLRVGKRGVPFVCYKFRTMVLGANRLRKAVHHLNERRGPFFKIANDPRVTPLGRFLRKYSLDELPQFWNVLKGDMSLVGPRPHPLEDVKQYSAGHEERLEVIPGMTGLWQVTARENPSFETCMQLDVGYIRHWSLWLDCKILLRTFPAVLAGEGQ
jgi:exopolysaccharide biosynthesis polyprenyl glycosylphosphotransferase